jgi:eukaryotic-like serine/threonine-protein kinase
MAEPHKQVGDYEIVRELGKGGMGQVYLVRNLISDRIEAMKVLLPDLAQQGDLANRFMREIKLLASLDHPNIAQLRTAFTAENQLVMIMEYVEGDTLAHRLEFGAFSTADTLNYITQVLNALSYAHGKGIIHRDIKPSNMMLTPQGMIKLMDFGIARSTSDLGMTVTGTTMGSLDYMSPEQVKSEPTDARSDLYSVGVSIYEMVTGHRMFGATSSYSVMEAHVKEIPRAPIEVQPSIPKQLNDIIMMAVAKDPGQRFQTAEAFRNALSQVEATGATPVPVPAGQAAHTPAPITPAPVPAPSATPTPAPAAAAAYTPALQPARGGRHVGWLVVAAIVVLVALFGGTQVYRSRKQNAAVESAMPTSTTTTAAPTPAEPQPAPPPQPSPSATAAPVDTAPATPAPTHRTATPPAQMAPAPVDNGPTPEEIAAQKKLMDDMEHESDQLDSRAAAVESSVGTLEQQMHQSGLGLRGDIVESRANLRNDMAKAKQALDTMDTDRARKFLDMANRELDKLEAFVGRR